MEKSPPQVVFAPAWIGDTAMAAPFFASLRAALPGRRIEAVASPWTGGLLGTYPWIDEVHIFGGGGGFKKWRGFFPLWRLLQKERRREAWLLPNSFRSALTARLIGAERRIGYATDGRGWLLTHPVPPPPHSPPPHLIDYYINILEAQRLQPKHREVRLPVTAEAARFADELLSAEDAGDGGPIVGVHPGAFFGDSKTWKAESFGALARMLAEKDGARVILLGGPGEADLAESVRAASKGAAANLAGRDTLSTLPGILARLDVFVSGDTGPLHVAALVGTPTVSLFGPTDPRRTAPRGEGHKIIRRDLDCSPCFARTCPLGHHKCMAEIAPEVVADAVRNLVREEAKGALAKKYAYGINRPAR